MNGRPGKRALQLAHLVPLTLAALIAGCGGDDDGPPSAPPPTGTTEVPLTVAKVASCSTGDNPEKALQGQVPAALRTGYTGNSCNLKLVGQFRGEGGNWSSAVAFDRTGHKCAYHATSAPVAGRANPGVPVLDITDPANPVKSVSLTTTAMLDPWESLRVNQPRGVLMADDGTNGGGQDQVDLYDISTDCRSPQLLAAIKLGGGAGGGIVPTLSPRGHEGNFAPDGLTYYIGDLFQGYYYAVDVTNVTRPKLLAQFDLGDPNVAPLQGIPHGLSVSNDGNRAYFVSLGGLPFGRFANPVPDPASGKTNNGFYVLDTSEVQARKPGAQIKLISAAPIRNGSIAQHTIPVKIGGKDYMVHVDEAGAAGLQEPTTAQAQKACNANLSPFPMAHIFDMSDEKNPKEVSALGLETHVPANCNAVLPDVAGLSTFSYGSHYCSVDNRDNATAMACGYFNSGIRVFDIRDPVKVKEIAYYNPASAPSRQLGSANSSQWAPGRPDRCASRIDFDFKLKQLVTMCQDNGLVVLQFESGWPFAESTASSNQN